MIVILVSFKNSYKRSEKKSHVRYPSWYPQLRNAEETAEYQHTAGVPLAPQIGFPMIFGNLFSYSNRRNSNDFKPYGSDAKSLQKSKKPTKCIPERVS